MSNVERRTSNVEGRVSNPFSTIDHRPSTIDRRRAFTLIEILIVMGIIVLLIALALPAFNFMTGARSVEAATNQLSAVLGIARADAVGIQEDRGVVIFHDAATGKDAIGECELRTFPFANFIANANYVLGQYVMYPNAAGKAYVCTLAYADDGTAKPNTDTAHWRELKSATAATYGLQSGEQALELRFDREYQTLPTGISIRGAGNAVTYRYAGPVSAYVGTTYDSRYLNPGVCLFDSNGAVVLRSYRILFEGILAQRMGTVLNDGTVVNQTTDDHPVPFSSFDNLHPLGSNLTAGSNPLQSQIGFVLFDNEQFNNVTRNGATPFNPASIDAWLDQNATPVMVNRYNGTLVKGE